MPRKSNLVKLDQGLRDELDRLLREGKHTITAITDHLKALGADTSRAAVGRYSQNFDRVMQDVRRTREMARAIGKELSDVSDQDSTRLLTETLQSLLLKALMQLGENEGEADAGELADMAKAIKDVGQAMKTSVDVELKVRQKALDDAAKVVVETGKKEGLSEETVNLIREKILGVKRG